MRLITVLLFFAATASAQPHYFRHYQVENGLSNNSVFCSIQDKNGFMWFGTKDGLNRFDGYMFKAFHINPNDESSLKSDYIFSVAIDRHGTLWAGSQKGLYWFDAQKERLVPLIDSLHNISDVYIDRHNQLWFLSAYTAYRYNFATKQLTSFPPGRYFSASSLFELHGSMWFSSLNGYLHQLNPATGRFTSYNVFSHSPKAVSNKIEKIAPDGKGSIFVGTSNQGLKKFDTKTLTYKDILTYNPDKTTIFVRDIIHTKEQELWFATESGIYILDTGTGKFTHLRKKYLDPYSLSDNAVYTLLKDSEGGIWAGTYFGGVNYVPQQFSSFQKYFPDYSGNSISGSAVREICEDRQGNVWIATEDAGLNKLNVQTGQITRFKPTGKPTGIAYSNIHGLVAVQNDLWIGTFEHGLDVMDIKTGKVKKHYTAGSGATDLKSNFIVTFLKTENGDIYVGTGNGLYKYNRQNDDFTCSALVPNSGFISCLIEDHSGTVWVGTHDMGLFYFNPASGEKGHFQNEPHNKNSLTTNTINALHEDSFRNLWIATEGGGLLQLSVDRKQFTRYTTHDGLPSNFVFKILEDNKKTLWISTSKGLVNKPITQGTTTVYTKANGLLNDQFNYNSGYRNAAGKLYFGSVRGMITFTPDNFHKNQFIAPVYITGFQVQNKELEVSKDTNVLKKSLLYTSQITLPYDQSSFSIDFAALSFTSPEMTEYSYKTEGLDEDWTYLKSNRKVYFTSLKPGTYAFKVKAGHNGIWNPQIKELTILIKPPFWATKWAYLIYFIAANLFLFYLIRTYHRIQENKKEKEIYEAKIEFFTNIAHEIRTPLTLIKGPVENLSEMVDQHPEIAEEVITMERNTNRLISLINQILDFRQTETKGFSLDFSNVCLNEIMQDAFVTFEPLAKKRGLAYAMNLPSDPVYALSDAESLNKVFTNLFSNAVKYAEREVVVNLFAPHEEDKKLTIEFSNDGPMIPKEMKEKIFEPFFRIKGISKQKGTGLGLALARSLVELHDGKLYLKEQEERLNVFVLELSYPFTQHARKHQAKPVTNHVFVKTQ